MANYFTSQTELCVCVCVCAYEHHFPDYDSIRLDVQHSAVYQTDSYSN